MYKHDSALHKRMKNGCPYIFVFYVPLPFWSLEKNKE